jgi:hypothetical protein
MAAIMTKKNWYKPLGRKRSMVYLVIMGKAKSTAAIKDAANISAAKSLTWGR